MLDPLLQGHLNCTRDSRLENAEGFMPTRASAVTSPS